MLSGAQLGITITGLLVGFVAEPMVGEPFGVLLGATGVPTAAGVAVGTVVTLAAATIIQMIFGELYPKNLAVSDPEPLARRLARSTLSYMTVFGWLISLFDKSANLLLRALRIEPVHDLDISASATDLQHIIADSRDSGDLSAELSIMIDRVLDFPQRDVEHAMVPRSQVDWVSPDTTLDELRTLMARAHTRYPVVDDDDAPVGVVHLSDILTRLGEGQIDETVGSVMRPATVIPTLMPLPDALEHLVSTTNQLACVIDEFGGFAGVLTIEDLAMEIVGEITDEHDIENGAALVSEGDNIWIMEGDVHLDEVERAIGHDLPRGDFETVAGLLIAEAGALPSEGDTVIVDLPVDPSELVADEPELRRLEVDVLRVERYVPAEVRVRLVEMSAAESVR
jgi:CBS domain containing-hemolysin-like protein